jgi:type II secretion system protein I
MTFILMGLMLQKAEEMMLLTGKRQNKGFLLVEVMISIAIFSISIVLILSSFVRSIRAMELSEDYFKAGLLLEDKMYEVFNSEIQEGSKDGTFSDFDKRFSWNLDIERIEEDSINEISLEVLWEQGAKKHSLSIVTYEI